MTPLELILSKSPNARRVGDNQWEAECPAHDDQRASLSIAEGDDGRVLLHCHAGCTTKAVCDALGLQLSDLFRDTTTAATATKGFGITGKSKPCRRTNGETSQTYPTADAAIAPLEHTHGPCDTKWTYHNANSEVVGVVLRWNKPNRTKEIRPVSRHADGSRIGGMPEPRPLYGLPDLAKANRVYVCEGEKAADAARSIGLTATCSAHGAKSAGLTDWTPLAGKEVVLLPDNDEAGRQYARVVAGILAKLRPAPIVKRVELPDLPKKGDIFDFVAAHAGNRGTNHE